MRVLCGTTFTLGRQLGVIHDLCLNSEPVFKATYHDDLTEGVQHNEEKQQRPSPWYMLYLKLTQAVGFEWRPELSSTALFSVLYSLKLFRIHGCGSEL